MIPVQATEIGWIKGEGSIGEKVITPCNNLLNKIFKV